MPIFGKKRIFCQNYTILWAIKVNKMPFFSRFFTKKSLLSYQIYKASLSFGRTSAGIGLCFRGFYGTL